MEALTQGSHQPWVAAPVHHVATADWAWRLTPLPRRLGRWARVLSQHQLCICSEVKEAPGQAPSAHSCV